MADLQDLISALYRSRAGADPIGAEAARVAAALPVLWTERSVPQEFSCATELHLAAALDGDGVIAGHETAMALCRVLREAAARLAWRYSYPARPDLPALEDVVSFAQLIGPRGLVCSDAVCVGLTLMAPDTFYPAHAHPAVELYFVLSGSATWTADGVETRRRPGEWVLHRSGVAHAMRTDAQPLLAVYSWTGEIGQPSVYVAA